eukprot:699054-Prymnesium_polylepis.2
MAGRKPRYSAMAPIAKCVRALGEASNVSSAYDSRVERLMRLVTAFLRQAADAAERESDDMGRTRRRRSVQHSAVIPPRLVDPTHIPHVRSSSDRVRGSVTV